MKDNELQLEANKICKELIKINKNNKSLDSLVLNLLDKDYKQYMPKIMMYIANDLANQNYIIKSINPFKLEKK